MSRITQIRDYAAWTENLDTALEITTDGANVRVTGAGTRFTMSPAAARQLAAILLSKAAEAARTAGDVPSSTEEAGDQR